MVGIERQGAVEAGLSLHHLTAGLGRDAEVGGAIGREEQLVADGGQHLVRCLGPTEFERLMDSLEKGLAAGCATVADWQKRKLSLN